MCNPSKVWGYLTARIIILRVSQKAPSNERLRLQASPIRTPRAFTRNDANMSSALEAKIVVLGSQGVGKTSLVMRYCKGAFQPSQLTSTVGASFMTKRVVDSDTDTVVRLQIWDTGKFKERSRPSQVRWRRDCLTPSLTPIADHLIFGATYSRPGEVPVHLAPLLPGS